MYNGTSIICTMLGLAAASLPTWAGTFSNDFNAGTNAPPGTTLNGSAVIEATGGENNSGALKLTKAINGQSGSFVIDDLDAGAPVYGFDLTANVRVGGGTSTPADGFSINFDPTAIPTTTTGEEGTAGGITFAFDIYDNGANENVAAPSIDFKVGGVLVATHHMTIADFDTGTGFANLHITVGADGGVSLTWKSAVIFTNIYFERYQALSGASFVFGARTGGLNDNQWFDNLSITTFAQPKVGIFRQPVNLNVLAGHDAVFSVGANNTDNASFQWYKNGTEIAGARALSLTVPAVSLADEGSKYKLTITGPNNTVTTDEVTLSVRDIPVPSAPKISFNFDDGQTPAGTTLYGNPDQTTAGYITTTGGANNSGVLHLSDAANGVLGAFIIGDVDAGMPVYGLTVTFDVRVGGGSEPPADGFSFNFATDIPDVPTGAEDGIGTGLTVGFDIFDNGGGEGPSIDVRSGGQQVAQVKVPLSFITTGDAFVPVLIRMQNDGTIDVAFNGVVIHDNVSVPGFSSISGGRFALVGRTGGLNENQWVDNLKIDTVLTAGDLRITTQPAAQTVLVGKPATFSLVLNDPTGVSFQWFRDGTVIPGATSVSYTVAAAAIADNGAKFKVRATRGNLNVTSDEVILATVDLSRPANPTVSYNFDDGKAPAGTVLTGTDTTIGGYITTTGGVNDSGVVHLVDAANGAGGAFVIQPLLGGGEVGTFTAAFDVLVGGGSTPPADGFSFNFAPDLPDITIGEAENGGGSGITVGFDIFDNGNETPPAPSVDVHYKGAIIASVQVPYPELETGAAFKTVLVHLSADGKLDVAYGDRVFFNGLQLPGYAPISGGKFGFYARTGGLNENIWLDNVAILAVKSTAPLRITQDISDLAILPGSTAAFTVAVSDPSGATYEWFRDGNMINGATTASYTTPPLAAADSGAKFKVVVTGPGGTATSHEAVVTVVPAITVSNPKISFNFDDGQVPPGAEFNGSATAANGDGILHLTDASNGQGGSILISDFDNGQPVSGFTAHFKLLEGGGTAPPADGLSFVWVNDLPSGTVFGEDGSGTGLIISFDIYDNGNETPPAPSIDARYNGQTVATVHLPYQQMETGAEFADFVIRVETDGTLDLQFKNMVIFNNVQLPGFAPATGASFGIGARTGGLNENQWIDNLAISTTTGAVAPSINFAVSGGGTSLNLTWPQGFWLQSTAALSPINWAYVAGASSPLNVPTSSGAQFYRLTSLAPPP